MSSEAEGRLPGLRCPPWMERGVLRISTRLGVSKADAHRMVLEKGLRWDAWEQERARPPVSTSWKTNQVEEEGDALR